MILKVWGSKSAHTHSLESYTTGSNSEVRRLRSLDQAAVGPSEAATVHLARSRSSQARAEFLLITAPVNRW